MRLGFFMCTASGCAASPGVLADRADASGHTGVFAWLRGHTPQALVVSGIPPGNVRPIVPGVAVQGDTGSPCAQAKRAHAAWLVLAERSERAVRDRAEDCGYALFRDAGALVVAPW